MLKKSILFLLSIALLLVPLAQAIAEGEPIVIAPVTTPEPPAIPAPPTPRPAAVNYCTYKWTAGDIDTTAQAYWKYCNTDAEKAAYTMAIVNRVMSDDPRFPDTVEGVVTKDGEFDIATARCTDRNRALAEVNLNRCMTEWLVGSAGVVVPKTAVYVDRVDGVLTMYDAAHNIVFTL